MNLSEDLRKLRVELEAAEAEVARWTARAHGLQAEIGSLELAVHARGREADNVGVEVDLRLLSRTDAIEHVLRRATDPLGIRQVIAALERAGREKDDYALVAATLQQLLHQKRVRRPGRGLYVA